MRTNILSKIAFCVVSVVLCFSAMAAEKEDVAKTAPKVDKIGKDGAPMVLIPAGEFQMGTDPAEIPGLVQWVKGLYPDLDVKASLFEAETPRHTVYVDAFYMDIYEVTNAQYRKFVQATGRSEPEGMAFTGIEGKTVFDFKPWSDKRFNGDNQPVVCVSYDDAKAYAEWAGKRLPTEAEWEKAALGGLIGKKYPWGDSEPNGTQCNDVNVDDGHEYTAPVGSYRANSYGLHDMAGNVYEWCADWYGRYYYSSSPKRNPTGPSSGKWRVLRDGSWLNNYSFALRCANRYYEIPPFTFYLVGFRCSE